MKPNHRNPLLAAVLFTLAVGGAYLPGQADAQTLFYKSTTAANVWTGSFWGTSAAGPFTGAWVSGRPAEFVDNGGTALALTGATTNFSSIVANESVNVTAAGTLGTGGTVASITVATGKNMNFGTQAISVAAGTGFIKNGDGILTISTGSAFTGGFTINAGTMAVGGVNAMGAGGALTINGGTIRSNNTTARDLTGKYTSITIGGNFAVGDATNNGALTFSNNMALGANSRAITVNSAATFGGIISGAAAVGIVKDGAGTLTLSNAGNNYTGATSISAGTLSLTGSLTGGGAVSTSGTGILSQSAAGVISGASTFTQGSSGTSTLSGANSYTGTTNINAGIVQVTNATSLGTTAGNTVVGSGGTLFMGTVSLSIAEALNLTGTGSSGTNGALNFGGGVSGMAVTGAITLGGAARIQGDGNTGATLSGGINLGANALTYNTDGGATHLINTTGISGVGGSLIKTGGGNLVLNATNSYTGTTSVTGGTLRFVTQASLYGGDDTKWTATNLNVQTGGTLAFNVGGASQFTNANITTLLANLAVSGSATEGMNAGSNIAFNTDTTPQFFSIADVIANSTGASGGARGLTKLGVGTLVLTNANTYTGATSHQGGTLRLENTTATPSITMSSGTILQIGTNTAYSAGPQIISTAGTIVSDRATAGAGLTHAFAGVSRLGSGNTNITAGTNVTSGTAAIQFASLDNDNGTVAGFGLNPTTANVIVTGGVNMGGGANAGDANFTLTGTSTGNSIGGAIVNGARANANLIKSGTSTWTLSGANTYNGTTAVNGGLLILDYGSGQDNSKLSNTSALTLGNATLQLSGGTHTETVLSTALTANTASRVTSSGGSVLQMNAITRNAGATIEFGASGIATTDTSNTNGILGTWATIAGTDFAANFTNGADGLITAATYTDVTRQVSGTKLIADVAANNVRITEGTTGGAADITLAAGTTTINTLNQSIDGGTSAAVIDPNGQTLRTHAILAGPTAGLLTIGNGVNPNGILTTATAGGELRLISNSTNGITINSVINDNTTASTLVKAGTGLVTLGAANGYTGTTTISEGTLKFSANNTLTGGLTFGSSTGSTLTGTLDLTAASASFGSLSVLTNTASSNTIATSGGRTLTIGGNVTIGVNVADAVASLVTTGAGDLVVGTGAASTFIVGGASGSTLAGSTAVDFSSLNSFTLNYSSTGTFRLGDNTTGSNGPVPSTLKLAQNNTITAGNFRIGDSSGGAATHVLTLGSGTNTINATTVNIGSAGAGIRSGGSMIFDPADTTGTLDLRGFSGAGTRTTLNIVNTTGSTAVGFTSIVNLAGHTSNILVSTLTMATRAGTAAGPGTATLTFDQGSLDVTTLNMSNRSGTAGTTSATVNLGDSAALGVPTSTIGAITMAVSANTGTATANLNISGGNVGITSINMANAGTGGTATSNINLTGGTTTLAGNITRTGGPGTENATITLNGGTLNMGGFGIGGASAISLVAQQGTLRNVGTINSTGGLTKTTSGTLTVGGTNTYTGATLVSAGTLFVTGALISNVSVSDTATVGGGGTVGAISFGGGSFFDIALAVGVVPDSLSTGAISFAAAGFGVDNLVFNGNTVDWSTIANGTYTLLTGTLDSLTLVNLGNFGEVNALDIDGMSGDRSAYFQSGSLQLVVIPEPNVAALIGALGGILLLRRRR